jgi:hypothetical protein
MKSNITFCQSHCNSNADPFIKNGAQAINVLHENNSNVIWIKWLSVIFGTWFGLSLSYTVSFFQIEICLLKHLELKKPNTDNLLTISNNYRG